MLRRFLEGWAGQSGDPDLEVVVVHAGGTQDPGAIADRFESLDVRIVELVHVNDGADVGGEAIAYSAARNLGAAHARGEHLWFADADTIAGPHAAIEMQGALQCHDALLTGVISYLPPDADTSCGFDELRELARPHPARPAPVGDGVDLSFRHELVWGLSMAMRRSTFAAAGGFDEGYHGYAGEDTDLAVALRAHGVPAGVVPGVEVLHQHHDSWEPPLHQFNATIENARRYHDKWGEWPMEGWLGQFENLGLIDRDGDSLYVVRQPTADEIDRHHMTCAAPFRTP